MISQYADGTTSHEDLLISLAHSVGYTNDKTSITIDMLDNMEASVVSKSETLRCLVTTWKNMLAYWDKTNTIKAVMSELLK